MRDAPSTLPDRSAPDAGWSPPVERLTLSWDEVAMSWLGAGGLFVILAVAALIGHEPTGGDVIAMARAQPPAVQQVVAPTRDAPTCQPPAA
jgi:hypothetical protein